jgi:DNA-binding MarR family transcriptional regulator
MDLAGKAGTTMLFGTTLEYESGGTAVADPPEGTECCATAEAMDDTDAKRARALEAFVARILTAAEESASGSYVAARRRILRDLERYGPQTAAGLPHEWPVTVEQVSRLLGELEEDGLVEHDAHARDDRYRLTKAGAAALAGTRRVQTGLISKLLEHVAAEDPDAAGAVFETLQAALGATPR